MYKKYSNWKLPYINPIIINLIWKKDISKNLYISKLIDRNSFLPSCFSGLNLKIHTGKRNHSILYTNNMVGLKIGTFGHTKKLSREIHYKPDKKYKTKSRKVIKKV